jgi:chemotaxis protein CheY-P-specific phosphatase CheC
VTECKDPPRAEQLEALGEIINLGIQNSCWILSSMLVSPLHCELEEDPCFTRDNEIPAPNADSDPSCQVHLRFNGKISGTAVFSLDRNHTASLLEHVTGRTVTPGLLDTLDAGTFSEIGSMVMDGVMSSLSRVLGLNLIYQVPTFRQGVGSGLLPTCFGESWITFGAPVRMVYEGWQAQAWTYFYLDDGSCRVLIERIKAVVLKEV